MVAVVQRSFVAGGTSGNYPSNIIAGNSVFVAIITFSASNVTIGSSAVTVAGQSLTKLFEVQSPYTTQTNYIAIWGAANSPGGSSAVSATVTNGSFNPGDGLVIWEASGLGNSWTVDKTNSGVTTASTSVSSGSTGTLSQAIELALGAMLFGNDGVSAPTGLANTQAINPTFSYCWGGDSGTTSTTALTFAATGTSGENLAAIISIAPAAAGAAAFTQPGTAARTPARARKGGSQGSTGAPVIPPVPAQFTGPHAASAGRIAGTGYSSGSGGAPAPGGSGSISVVITKSNSLTPTIPSTIAGNCLLVLIASKGSSGSAASVSGITLGGSAGNFASLAAAHGTDGFTDWADAFAWADPSCAGGQTAVSVSGSNLGVGSGIGGVTVLEISGIAASSPLDKSSTGNGQSSSFASGATATTTVAAELWAAIAATPGSATGPESPWTDESPPGSAAAAAYQVVSSTGTASYSGTCSNEAWAALVVTLKGGSTAAAPFTGITATRRGRRAATGSSAGSPGAVVIAGGPVTPAPFPQPHAAVRGRPAAAHRPSSGSPGAPVTAPGPVTPATFTGPHCAVRGRGRRAPDRVRLTRRAGHHPAAAGAVPAAARGRPRPASPAPRDGTGQHRRAGHEGHPHPAHRPRQQDGHR